jgi:hypothetical protein
MNHDTPIAEERGTRWICADIEIQIHCLEVLLFRGISDGAMLAAEIARLACIWMFRIACWCILATIG